MDREFLTDLFADFGPVAIRPMFSGFGISVDGVNFALSRYARDSIFAPTSRPSRVLRPRARSLFRIRPASDPLPSPHTGNCRRGCLTIRKN